MTPRERILAAMDNKPVDIVPFDLSGTKTSSMNPHAERKLKKYLGMKRSEVWGNYRFQRMHMHEDMSRYFDVDVRRVGESFPYPMPEEAMASKQIDEFGVTWLQGDNGLFMPGIENPPLKSADTSNDLKAYAWPDPEKWQPVDVLAEKAEQYHKNTDYAVCVDLPDCVVQYSQYLRGTEQWMMDLVLNKTFASLLMGYITDIYVEMVKSVLKAAGENADLVIIPDDMGGQNGLLMSPETYRELIKPCHKKIFDAVKSVSDAKILLHSCGANYPLLGDYCEIGVDALNPVQVSAAGMETQRLKKDFGKDLCFWGAVDTQHVLSKGSRKDVLAEVKKRVEDLSSEGGYVIAPVHVIQAEVPPENILALAEGAHIYGGRSDGNQFLPENAFHRFVK